MTKSGPIDATPCFTDFAIEEYVLGRLDLSVREDFAVHITECEECAACMAATQQETASIRGAMHLGGGEAQGDCAGDETLALFLDEALAAEERERLLSHIATCATCNRRLLLQYRDLQELELRAGQSELGAPEAAPIPAGLILRMPKRKFARRRAWEVPDSEAGEGTA